MMIGDSRFAHEILIKYGCLLYISVAINTIQAVSFDRSVANFQKNMSRSIAFE